MAQQARDRPNRAPIPRRTLLGGSVALASAALPCRVRAQQQPIRIGVINDQNGPYVDSSGPGSVVAARLAVADMGGEVLGRPIELLVGDHQNKPDVGLGIVRNWYANADVRMVADFANSAISIACQQLTRDFDRIAMHVSSTSSDLSGTACTGNAFQWAQDTYSNATGLFQPLTAMGRKTYFFVTVDYTFGASLEANGRAAIAAGGGRVLGAAKFPLGTADFGSYLTTAQASGAEVVVIASSGVDTVNAVKQAAEFGLTRKQLIVTPIAYLTDIRALGLEAAGGLQFVQSWYWDLTEASRTWARRFFAERKRMPTDLQAGVYSATLHYLRSVAATGTTDTNTVVAAMKAAPVKDMYTPSGRIAANNKMIFDLHLMRTKTPGSSSGEWDLLEKVATIDGNTAFRRAAESGCKLAF